MTTSASPTPGDGPVDSPIADPTARVLEEVAQLRDLFQRRLLEDKAKARLYDELIEQLAIARGGLAEQLLGPLFRELLLVVDRVESLTKDGDVVLASIAHEIQEILERHAVSPVPTKTAFDPSIHEALRTVPSETVAPGDVVQVTRRGYTHNAKLLRAERVVVATTPVPESSQADDPSAVEPSDSVNIEPT